MKPSLIALCSLVIFAACSEAPRSKILLSNNYTNNVVYGDDSMTLPQDQTSISSNENFQRNVKASMAMIYRKDLQETTTTFHLPDKKVRDTFNTCPEFRYSESKNPALCSAVLIDPQLALTAAHCMTLDKDTCSLAAFVFGFNDDNQELAKDQVYLCKKVRALSFFEKGNLNDYALVELDRPVPDVQPVKIKPTPLSLKDSIYTLGYPLGTSKKYSDGFIRSFDRILAVTTLDEYAGNSGGPVFDQKTHELVGIVNSGEIDLEETPQGCQMPKICKEDECMGENILPITAIMASLKEKGEAGASPSN